jgi:hypothetical protein
LFKGAKIVAKVIKKVNDESRGGILFKRFDVGQFLRPFFLVVF